MKFVSFIGYSLLIYYFIVSLRRGKWNAIYYFNKLQLIAKIDQSIENIDHNNNDNNIHYSQGLISASNVKDELKENLMIDDPSFPSRNSNNSNQIIISNINTNINRNDNNNMDVNNVYNKYFDIYATCDRERKKFKKIENDFLFLLVIDVHVYRRLCCFSLLCFLYVVK